jgi:hypothetical protein
LLFFWEITWKNNIFSAWRCCLGSDSGLTFEKQSDMATRGSEFLGDSEQSSDVFYASGFGGSAPG